MLKTPLLDRKLGSCQAAGQIPAGVAYVFWSIPLAHRLVIYSTIASAARGMMGVMFMFITMCWVRFMYHGVKIGVVCRITRCGTVSTCAMQDVRI
jgi:hypothetical protein